jgi:hypothetical protein
MILRLCLEIVPKYEACVVHLLTRKSEFKLQEKIILLYAKIEGCVCVCILDTPSEFPKHLQLIVSILLIWYVNAPQNASICFCYFSSILGTDFAYSTICKNVEIRGFPSAPHQGLHLETAGGL